MSGQRCGQFPGEPTAESADLVYCVEMSFEANQTRPTLVGDRFETQLPRFQKRSDAEGEHQSKRRVGKSAS